MYMIVALHFPGGQACWDIICKHLGLKFQNLNIAFFPFVLKQPVKYIQENEESIQRIGHPKYAIWQNTRQGTNIGQWNPIRDIQQIFIECLLWQLSQDQNVLTIVTVIFNNKRLMYSCRKQKQSHYITFNSITNAIFKIIFPS